MRKLSAREKIIFVLTVMLVIGYGGYYGLYEPMLRRVEDIDIQIAAQERRMSKDKRTVKNADAVQTRYEQYLQKYRTSRTEQEIMSGIISEVEAAANRLGLKIADIKPNRVNQEKYFNEYSVSLTIDSQLIEMVQFL
ncbi:MAG: hypothetical protein KC713_01695, partial [Candidatus Omnitrophica bacterium]|nr:hypothetical protein [Candidatus Omnitrophota bacterium]